MHEIFKGLLFLHGYANAADLTGEARTPRSGARAAAATFARPLGNRVLSRAWFGARHREPAPATSRGACA